MCASKDPESKELLFYVVAAVVAMIMTLLCSCAHAGNVIPYQDDIAYLSSGEGGAYEHTFSLQGKIFDGKAMVNHSRFVTANLLLLPRPYSYQLELNCSGNFSRKLPVTGKQVVLSFDPKYFEGLDEFVCYGVVSPDDRSEPITSKFKFELLLTGHVEGGVKYRYAKREEITLEGDTILFGRYALYGQGLTDQGKHLKFEKTTSMPWPKNTKSICLETESLKARFNYKCLP